MRVFVLLSLFLATSSCVTMPKISWDHGASEPHPNAVVVEPVEFEKIDLNDDGNISKKEVERYNKIKSDQTPEQDLITPVKAIVGIILLTLIVCLAVAVRYKKKPNDSLDD